VAPRLRQAKIALEHARTRDTIGHLLEQRPQPEELIASGVVHSFPLASRLQGVQRQLQHNMTTDKVGHLLEKRSDIDDLQTQNILKDIRVAPALQGPQRALERNLAKANLYHALKHRPSIEELQKLGIYHPYEKYFSEDDSPAQNQFRAHHQQAYQQHPDNYNQYAYQQQQAAAMNAGYEPAGYQRRSKNFHLTRILLKFVASMAEAGELSLQQKGYLKDLIVDQDSSILAIADQFDSENDINDFKDCLCRLATRR